jgi:hypothetical protein
MSDEQLPESHSPAAPEPETADLVETSTPLPPWIPVLIGLVLVALAGLAVYTGLRYRRSTLVDGMIKPRRVERMAPGMPGEQAPGSSLVLSGSGDEVPTALPPVSGHSRTQITNGPNGIATSTRLWARRGMLVHADPPDAEVYVNGLVIGEAQQFDAQDKIYDFPAAGSYDVRISKEGFKDVSYVITASNDAKQEVATLNVKLPK